MSMSIPPIPSLVQPAYHAWVRPIAQASFWLSLLLTVYFVMQGLLLWPLHNLPIWHLVEREVQDQHLHSLIWLLAHPVAASLIVALLCLASTLASWGLLRERSWRPDAVFMDLAMPGIDGWETIRRLRHEALAPAAVAIVSANAFDKGLENDVGITPRDFITKPVRVAELLDWLGGALSLRWSTARTGAPVATPAPSAADVQVLPPEPQLRALQELVDIGYVRGIVKRLDQIERELPESTAFVERMRTMARGFQLDEMSGVLKRALAEA